MKFITLIACVFLTSISTFADPGCVPESWTCDFLQQPTATAGLEFLGGEPACDYITCNTNGVTITGETFQVNSGNANFDDAVNVNGVLTINPDGRLVLIKQQSIPATLSPTNGASIIFDGTNVLASTNGSAYSVFGGGGSVTSYLPVQIGTNSLGQIYIIPGAVVSNLIAKAENGTNVMQTSLTQLSFMDPSSGETNLWLTNHNVWIGPFSELNGGGGDPEDVFSPWQIDFNGDFNSAGMGTFESGLSAGNGNFGVNTDGDINADDGSFDGAVTFFGNVIATNDRVELGSPFYGTNKTTYSYGDMAFDTNISAGTTITATMSLGGQPFFQTVAKSAGDGTWTNGSFTLPAHVQMSAPGNTNYTSYAAGTAYSLTDTAAQLNFGTTDPSITILQAGTYLIRGAVGIKYNGSTYGAAQTATLKFRRTNNTAADLSNGARTVVMPVLTVFTGGDTFILPSIIYTATAGDIVQIFGSVSAAPSAGSVDTDSAEIIAQRLY